MVGQLAWKVQRLTLIGQLNNSLANVGVAAPLSSNLVGRETMERPSTIERRRRARLKLPQTVRVRPSDPIRYDFDEILPTLNISRNSVYFASKNGFYKEGMRVFITFPYSDSLGSINRESLGRVVRVDDLGEGRRGIAVEILMPIYVGGKETVR